MASRGRSKKGKVVEESVNEDKENTQTRRTGRAKKPINYAESIASPVANKKITVEKSKAPKTEKESIKTVKQKTTQKVKESKKHATGNGEQEDKTTTKTSKSRAIEQEDKTTTKTSQSQASEQEDKTTTKTSKSQASEQEDKTITKTSKSRASKQGDKTTTKPSKPRTSARGKGKKINEDTESVNHVENKPTEKQQTKPNDKQVEIDVDEEHGENNEKNKRDRKEVEEKDIQRSEDDKVETENTIVTELHRNDVVDVKDGKRTKGKQTVKQTKENKRKPLGHHSDSVQNIQLQELTPKRTGATDTENNEHEEIIQDNICNEYKHADDMVSEEVKNCDKITGKATQQIENQEKEEGSSQNTANSTFTLENVIETPVTTNNRRTPGCSRSTQQNTPSSESRVSLVLSNIRKDSLSGNTPNSGHSECGLKMSQVYEILELVTDQLTDLKSEMEKVQSTNETIKRELESSKEESRQLKEDMKNLRNETIDQMKTHREQLQDETTKSTTNQNELDILWEQCDSQKKTIRLLHQELDNVNLEYNEKFDKYKKAMVFVLCKTRPEIKHSDVSKLRHVLNKTEEHLDLTLDEICSCMESEMPGSSPIKQIPSISVTSKGTSSNKNKNVVSDDRINGNILPIGQASPVKNEEDLNPFESKNKLQTTPNITKQNINPPRSTNQLKTTPAMAKQKINSPRSANRLKTTPKMAKQNTNSPRSASRLKSTPNMAKQNINSPRSANRLKTTPSRGKNRDSPVSRNIMHTTPNTEQMDNPFQARHKLKRTPVTEKSS